MAESKYKNINDAPRGGIKAWWVWGLASFFYLYEFIIRVAPSVMTDELQLTFSLSATQLAGALATYYYIYSPMQFFVGILLDRFGGKCLLVPASVVVGIGCFMVLVPNGTIVSLSIARLLMGLGSAFGFVGALYLASMWFPHSRLAMIAGLTTTLGMVGAIIGERPLSEFVEHSRWEEAWIWFGIIGFIVAILLLVFIPKPPSWEIERRKKHFKGHGAVGILDSVIIIAKNPQSWIIAFISGCMYMTLSVFGDQWGVQYVMKVTGAKKTTAAGAASMVYVGWLFGAPVIGFISDIFKRRKAPVLWGSAISLLFFIYLVISDDISIEAMHVILFIIGFTSSAKVITFVANMEINPNFARGTAVAFTNMVVMLIGGVFQHLWGFILDLASGPGYQTACQSTEFSYRMALCTIPAMMLLGFIACLCMKETYFCDEEETHEVL